MQLLNNFLLVLPDAHFTDDGGFEVFDIYDPAKHFSVVGTVLAVPKEFLFFGEEIKRERLIKSVDNINLIRDLFELSLETDCKIGKDIQVGDRVVFQYMNHINGIKDGVFIDFKGLGRALMIRYDDCFMVIQGEERKMLNGWMLVRPIKYKEEEVVSEYGVRKHLKEDKPGVAEVVSVGERCRYSDGSLPGIEDIKVGDTVIYRHSHRVTIEYKYHNTLGESLVKLRRKDVLGIKLK